MDLPQKKQPLPIGIDDYKTLIQGNYIHVDKTLLILEKLVKEALEQMRSNKYESQIKDFGHNGTVLFYRIAIFKKSLVAKMESLILKGEQ